MDEPRNEKQERNEYRPNPMNYDYVWGSDQDQYMREEASEEDAAEAEQEQES
ncbi:hypothetical protein H7B90_19150 [Cohnella xylanilytica]|uniref:Uncharacterized protein n=1 Tax=Cohnella xylanilytica TaxID=557555 RepID=A0A841U5D6_9BACL|nr:hypothetical protein [Cohnella xylanilytica]MBB6693513.1 hypothetical protein [Cohnella xylanilytica]